MISKRFGINNNGCMKRHETICYPSTGFQIIFCNAFYIRKYKIKKLNEYLLNLSLVLFICFFKIQKTQTARSKRKSQQKPNIQSAPFFISDGDVIGAKVSQNTLTNYH